MTFCCKIIFLFKSLIILLSGLSFGGQDLTFLASGVTPIVVCSCFFAAGDYSFHSNSFSLLELSSTLASMITSGWVSSEISLSWYFFEFNATLRLLFTNGSCLASFLSAKIFYRVRFPCHLVCIFCIHLQVRKSHLLRFLFIVISIRYSNNDWYISIFSAECCKWSIYIIWTARAYWINRYLLEYE